MKKRNKISQTPPNKPIITRTGKIPNNVGFPSSKTQSALWLKPATILVTSCLFFGSCDSNTTSLPTLQENSDKVIVVHVEDFSKSTDQINYFDSTAARNLCYSVAKTGGTLKLIGVYANSALQNVLTTPIEKLDTATADGISNVYKAGRVKLANKKIASQFETILHGQIAQYAAMAIKPHTENYTDLTNALLLAKTTLNQPIYSNGYSKYLLLCSDCINDVKGKRHAPFEPISLAQTTILIVRPKLSDEKLKSLFPASHVYTFTDVNDAISFITKQ